MLNEFDQHVENLNSPDKNDSNDLVHIMSLTLKGSLKHKWRDNNEEIPRDVELLSDCVDCGMGRKWLWAFAIAIMIA